MIVPYWGTPIDEIEKTSKTLKGKMSKDEKNFFPKVNKKAANIVQKASKKLC